jgi:hypothetical protein
MRRKPFCQLRKPFVPAAQVILRRALACSSRNYQAALAKASGALGGQERFLSAVGQRDGSGRGRRLGFQGWLFKHQCWAREIPEPFAIAKV